MQYHKGPDRTLDRNTRGEKEDADQVMLDTELTLPPLGESCVLVAY